MSSSDPEVTSPTLEPPRLRIARALLLGFVGLGLVAYLPSVWVAARVGEWGIVFLDTLVYLLLLAALVFARGRYAVQGGAVVAACYILGAWLSAALGPVGAGPLWLAGTPIAATILFDGRYGLFALLLVTATAALVAVLEAAGVLSWPNPVTGPLLWIVLSANAILLAGALTLAVGALADGLRDEMVERHRVESRMREADKLRAVGTLAAGIAHDFNNLLTPILTASELARTAAEPGSDQDAALGQTIHAALAGRDLVQRILAFSRPTGDSLGPTPAARALHDATRLLRASLPAGVLVERELDDQGYFVGLSPAEVHQIVLNLGTNARRALPEGGTVRFRMAVLDGQDMTWTTGPAPEKVLRIEVEDDGQGMPPELVGRIFEPFFTTDHDQGTGLGLATVHGIVSRANGQIDCRSAPGVGTTFTIDLPALHPPPPRAPTIEETELGGSGQHVLVVDDEPAVRDVAARVLRRYGYRVSTASDAPAALDLLDDHDDIALLLSDLNMPGINGIRLAEKARSRCPGLTVILMSGLVDRETEEAARRAGIGAVVAKPFRLRALVAAVGAAMERPPPA